jgi:hypothetical protein
VRLKDAFINVRNRTLSSMCEIGRFHKCAKKDSFINVLCCGSGFYICSYMYVNIYLSICVVPIVRIHFTVKIYNFVKLLYVTKCYILHTHVFFLSIYLFSIIDR